MHYSNHYFFSNDTPTTEIYTLSLHDALPISSTGGHRQVRIIGARMGEYYQHHAGYQQHSRTGRYIRNRSHFPSHSDRKSTRLNSSHTVISYAVFCLKKKKKQKHINREQKKN